MPNINQISNFFLYFITELKEVFTEVKNFNCFCKNPKTKNKQNRENIKLT